jgi:hypothetical protein
VTTGTGRRGTVWYDPANRECFGEVLLDTLALSGPPIQACSVDNVSDVPPFGLIDRTTLSGQSTRERQAAKAGAGGIASAGHSDQVNTVSEFTPLRTNGCQN